jgi:hypothetical protein
MLLYFVFDILYRVSLLEQLVHSFLLAVLKKKELFCLLLLGQFWSYLCVSLIFSHLHVAILMAAPNGHTSKPT